LYAIQTISQFDFAKTRRKAAIAISWSLTIAIRINVSELFANKQYMK